MTLGVSALVSRLDADLPSGPVAPPGRVDWGEFLKWNGGMRPAFAGKYFVGSSWRWAHGEATTLIDPVRPGGTLRIAPIAAGDPVRQARADELGMRWGAEDGTAVVAALTGAIRVGSLRDPGEGAVFVYLEVADPQTLTGVYWSGWAGAVAHGVLAADVLTPARQPFLPCLAVRYEPAPGAAGRWQLPAPLREVLDRAASPVTPSARCHGLWAITADTDPIVAAPALTWSALDPYSQPQADGPPTPVPVRIWRYATGVPEDPAHEVGRLTLESTEPAAGQPDPVLDAMLTAVPWTAAAPTVPTAIGVDRGDSLEFEMPCLSTSSLAVGHLPEVSPHGVIGPPLVPPLRLPATFAVRYYSAGPRPGGRPPTLREKDLKPAEAKVLSRLGVDVVACFEGRVEDPDIPAYLADPGHGYDDGLAAGRYAAEIIGQPAHQPIYFAVDCDVNATGVSTQPGNAGHAITDTQLIDYFKGVANGLEDAVGQSPEGVRRPYAVGAYACAHALGILYAHGLASHFWQNYPPFWGDIAGGPVHTNNVGWRHDNLWQVGMAYVPAVETSTGIRRCHRTFDLTFTDGPGPAGIRFKIDLDGTGETTHDVPYPPDLTNLAPWKAAARATAVQIKRFRPGAVTLRFAYRRKPVSVKADTVPAGLVVDFLTETDQVADANVAWGDTGGWRLPRSGR